MRANDHKPGWAGDEGIDLLSRLKDEAEELEEAIMDLELNRNYTKEAYIRVRKEAADVANFAMMIADNIGDLDDLLSGLPKDRFGWDASP